MSDFKLEEIYDSNGTFLYHDLVFEDGRFVLSEGIEEIKNRILAGLSTYLGENFTDTTYGTDYHNNVFGRSTDDTVFIDELKNSILNTRGVTGIASFEISEVDSNRTTILTSQVITTEGQINLTTPINT